MLGLIQRHVGLQQQYAVGLQFVWENRDYLDPRHNAAPIPHLDSELNHPFSFDVDQNAD